MRSQRGSATILGMIMILLLSVMGTTLLKLCTTHLQIATNHCDGIAAQYIAEAGIEVAIANLRTNMDFVNQTEQIPQEIPIEIPNSLPNKSNCKVQIGPVGRPNAENIRLIIATGTVNQTKRQITTYITLPKPEDELKKIVIIRNFREGEYFGT